MTTPGAPDDARPPKPPCPCPICKKMSVAAYHPFCSKRCADIDLSRWFSGVYAVPAEEQDEGDEGTPPTASRDDEA
ncbi:DNA gyrase inhibitor YacG [Methylopila sp. M107]|uniref:DNA gyrase inhibitor YacG n=1 Tax=Methylopila sp. M107 TaxID=1101190 RepID=UPI002476E481|nr:DNA gyrase inhibitor YacG [Methylopila sp. M107]